MPDRWEPKGDAWDMAANNKFRFIAAGTAKCDAISPLEFEHYRLKSNISSRSTERTIIRTPIGNNELGANGRAIAMSRTFQARAQIGLYHPVSGWRRAQDYIIGIRVADMVASHERKVERCAALSYQVRRHQHNVQ